MVGIKKGLDGQERPFCGKMDFTSTVTFKLFDCYQRKCNSCNVVLTWIWLIFV